MYLACARAARARRSPFFSEEQKGEHLLLQSPPNVNHKHTQKSSYVSSIQLAASCSRSLHFRRINAMFRAVPATLPCAWRSEVVYVQQNNLLYVFFFLKKEKFRALPLLNSCHVLACGATNTCTHLKSYLFLAPAHSYTHTPTTTHTHTLTTHIPHNPPHYAQAAAYLLESVQLPTQVSFLEELLVCRILQGMSPRKTSSMQE